MKFRFYIQKYVKWHPKPKMLKKTLTIEAIDLIEARKIVESKYPNWDISMFWPV